MVGGKKQRSWPEERQAAFLANIFPPAHKAIADPASFNWHWGAARKHSSQALAIDVFGAIKASGHASAVMSAIASRLGLPADGPWQVELEWFDASNGLMERTPTQVDAAAVGRNAIILFECKFTEGGGSCSQPKSGACSGRYALEPGSLNQSTSRCALSAKKIRYWDHVPGIYGIDRDADHSPCPFRYNAFQWMRNSALARSLAQRGMPTRVAAIYADASFLRTALKVREGTLGLPTLAPADRIEPMSYQSLIDTCELAAPDAMWLELRNWVEAKIEKARR